MRLKVILILTVLLLMATPLIAQGRMPSPDDQKQIDQLREGLVQSFNNRDIDGLLKYVEPDVVVVWQNGEINQGQDAVRQFYNKTITSGLVKSVSFKPEVANRVCRENTCISVGNLKDEFTLNDGSNLPLDSRFTALLVKDSGTWKIASFHASSNIFESPVTKYAARRTGIIAGVAGLVIGLFLGILLFRRRHA